MAGHSAWANTKHRKAAVDAKRGKVFSVISKQLTLAARDGGGDPGFNPRLRTLLLKAKAVNMPADNVDRAIKKGTGELPGVEYIELVYEGYGQGGGGIMVEVPTDNKNRSASEVRSTFTKHGGNLAGPGALAHSFTRQGQFIIEAGKVSEDKLMELALEAGADDVKNHGDHFEVLCPISQFDAMSQALENAKIEPNEAELARIPVTTIPVTDADAARKLVKLIDALEDLEDVQHVYANYEMEDSLIAA